MAIPSAATATVNLRTEPGTRTDQIVAELRRQVGAAASHDVSARMRLRSAVDPVRLPRRSPAMAVAAEAYRRGFGRPPVFVRSGGTIAAVGLLRRFLGAPVLMMGFSLPDDGAHGPDERIRLAVLWRAVDTSVFLLYGLGSLDPHDQTSPMDIVLSGNPGIVR
jgi:acetylornithine deacetylase/succinyl-diaminopimelate desuccinylase-like protein